MTSASVTNVIVTYNSAEPILGLLSDLRQHAPETQTILIDNASSDGTAEAVESQFPEVRLVCNAQNVGYARAVNQGIRLSSGPYVFLLNPDIRIRSRAVLEELQTCLEEEPSVAVAGPLQFKEDRGRLHLNFTWSYLTPRALPIYLSHHFGGRAAPRGRVRVSFLNAGCLFLRRSAFDAVGRLNEKYFLYGEEPDLFLKFMRHGYECRLLPGVSVVHARERSLQTVPFLKRTRHRLSGLANIADAVLRGVSALVVDRLTGRKVANP